MSFLKTTAIMFYVELFCIAVYGNEEGKNITNKKTFKGNYKVFKLINNNYELKKFSNERVSYHGQYMNYEKAKQFCSDHGGQLPKITTKLANERLTSYIKYAYTVKKDTHPINLKHAALTWIGLSDIAEEGKWVWDDGTPLGNYTNWKEGEPNDNMNKKNDEDCVIIDIQSTKWVDINCNAKITFACVTEINQEILPITHSGKNSDRTPVTTSTTVQAVTVTAASTTVQAVTVTAASTTTPKSMNSLACSRKILLIGGIEGLPPGSSASIEIYNVDKPKESQLINVRLLEPRNAHVSFLLSDQTVLIAGGMSKNDGVLASSEILNLRTSSISQGASMKERRYEAEAALLHDTPYVCGGYNEQYQLSSCERYTSDKWNYIGEMKAGRDSFALVAFYGNLYAISGTQRISGKSSITNTMERYNPIHNTWTKMKSKMSTRRSDPSAVVYDQLLHVCGGWNKVGKPSLSSCEIYKPKNNSWFPFSAKMTEPRAFFNLVAVGDRLFAMGPEKSVEVYDPKNKKWNISNQTLIYPRKQSSALVIS